MSMLTRREALKIAMARLASAGIEGADREARLLLSYALQIEALEIILRPDVVLSVTENEIFHSWLRRREKREPLARIHGLREFWGLPFGLNEATLEPRPDTECLVENIINHCGDKNAPLRFLDIGTGTGCILLSLLHEYPQASGIGTDKSARALEAARQNAVQLGLKNRAEFVETNWCDGAQGVFDVVVSNPPYLAQHELNGLQPEVGLFDPPLALDGGEDGLMPYRVIISAAQKLLNKGGVLAFEVGHTQSDAVQQMMCDAGFSDVQVHKDLQNIERVVMGQA